MKDDKEKGETQKITAHVPKELLKMAQKYTGEGITETVKKALEHLARKEVYEGLMEMRGKVKFSIDLNELRKDKDEL